MTTAAAAASGAVVPLLLLFCFFHFNSFFIYHHLLYHTTTITTTSSSSPDWNSIIVIFLSGEHLVFFRLYFDCFVCVQRKRASGFHWLGEKKRIRERKIVQTEWSIKYELWHRRCGMNVMGCILHGKCVVENGIRSIDLTIIKTNG